jgi:general stress protein 26
MNITQYRRGHLDELVRGFRTAMLVTHAEDGELRARPMSVAAVEKSGDLWFSTGISSTKADEMLTDPRVAIIMQDASRFVCVSGEAELIINRDRAAELWNEAWRPWFPGGPADPELALVRVAAHQAEFWDVSGLGGALYVLDAVRHAARRERMSDEDAEHHAKVSLPLDAAPMTRLERLSHWMKSFPWPAQTRTRPG